MDEHVYRDFKHFGLSDAKRSKKRQELLKKIAGVHVSVEIPHTIGTIAHFGGAILDGVVAMFDPQERTIGQLYIA